MICMSGKKQKCSTFVTSSTSDEKEDTGLYVINIPTQLDFKYSDVFQTDAEQSGRSDIILQEPNMKIPRR